jgi:hypothetical protein
MLHLLIRACYYPRRRGTGIGVVVKWMATLCAVVFALAWASPLRTASAQEPRDPLISPQEGGQGSRFQIVGQSGWVPGEPVMLRLGFTTAGPLAYAGPFPFEREVTVLRDGTWSFPVNVNDELFGAPLSDQPGYIVVRAESPGKTAQNAFIFTVNGERPAGAEAIAALGFGPAAGSPTVAFTAALFAAATGALLLLSGAWRRHRVQQSPLVHSRVR